MNYIPGTSFRFPFTLRSIIILLFSVFSFVAAKSQTSGNQIDSLSNLVKNSSSHLVKAKALVGLAELFYPENIDTVLILSQDAINLLTVNDPKNKNEAVKIQTMKLTAAAYNNMGVVYYKYGNYAKAVDYYIRALKIREDLKDDEGLTESYNNIAGIYKMQGDIKHSIELYDKSLEIATRKNDLKSISNGLNNLAVIYALNTETSGKALDFYLRSLDIETKLGNQREIGKREYNIGVVYHNKGNATKANEYYIKSLKTRSDIDDQRGMASSLTQLAKLRYETNNKLEAEAFAKKANEISKEHDLIENTIISDEILYKIYAGQNKSSEALARYVELTELKQQQFEDANIQETTKLQMQYDYGKKMAADSLKNASERMIADIKLQKQQEKQLVLYLVLFLAFVFSLVILNRFKITKKQKSVITQKQKEITDSINYALRIQNSILPPLNEVASAFPLSFVLYKPKDIVSGDFYWFMSNENGFLIAAADCTGHGVPGAFMSVISSEKLTIAAQQTSHVSEILSMANRGIKQTLRQSKSEDSTRDGMDICICHFDKECKTVTYAGANRSLWLIRKDAGSITEIKATKTAIGGLTKDDQTFDSNMLQITAGDTLYLCTDGYADQFSKSDKKLMTRKFKEILLAIQEKSMEEQKNYLETFIEDWKGNTEQTDDILVIGIRI